MSMYSYYNNNLLETLCYANLNEECQFSRSLRWSKQNASQEYKRIERFLIKETVSMRNTYNLAKAGLYIFIGKI